MEYIRLQRNCGKGFTNPDFSDILKKYKKIPQDKGESIMRLKRLVSVAAAAVLALSVSLTAFAAPSTIQKIMVWMEMEIRLQQAWQKFRQSIRVQ